MFQYGIGGLFANPVGGNVVANPTPQQMLTISDVSVDISQDLKELVGQYRFADDVAPGQMKISGKFSFGRNDVRTFNQLFFADVQQAGVKAIQKDENALVPSTGPYSVSVANALTFLSDLGVRSGVTGAMFTRVTGTPTTQQYSVSAGVYTFAAADIGLRVLISYVWNSTTTGYTVQFNQQLMGYGPVFELWLSEPYQSAANGVPNGIHLYCCRLSKLTQALKNMDYMKPEMDFQAFANGAGQVGELFQVAT